MVSESYAYWGSCCPIAISDIWNTKGPAAKEPERTKKLVIEFQSDVERICGPLVNRKFDGPSTKTLSQL